MFVLVPLRTDIPRRKRPVVNYALIAINVLVFLVVDLLGAGTGLSLAKNDLMLWSEGPRWYQFITSTFLHGGLFHLAGNMVFLYVFGNSLEHKLGHAAYFMFYLACGLFAGVGHVLISNAPAVGASGAIYGVAAGYLVLFPLSRVTCLYWIFFFIGFLNLSGLTLVGYYIVYAAFNVLTNQADGVAHMAHLAGAIAGLAGAMLLLAVRAVGRDQHDLLALGKQWNRRRSYRSYMSDPRRQAEARYGRMARDVEAREVSTRRSRDPQAERIADLRSQLAAAVRDGNVTRAADAYRSLREVDPDQVMPAKQQMELANQLMSAGHHELAARAYESFLSRYPTWQDIEQVQLLLGLIYRRYLGDAGRARTCLQRALEGLSDPNQRQLATDELAQLDEPTA